MIRTYEDLARLLGASEATDEAISSRVYKSTSCGAWAALTTITPTKTVQVIYEVNFTEENGFVYATRWRPYRKGWRPFTHKTTPRGLIDYLEGELDAKGLRLPDEFSSLTGLMKTTDDMISFKQPQGNRVTGQIKLNKQRSLTPRLAVQFGSVVEGVDFTTETATIELPASDKKVMQAIKDVEEDANYIWRQTHGCEECGKEQESSEFDGYVAINPNCTGCNGEGTIF